MYCINCGVKLEDTEQRCPLCGVEAVHPQISRVESEPLYPFHRYPAPQVNSKAAQIVVTTLLLIALLTTLFIDLRINAAVTWSGIVAGALLVGYTAFVLPFWFRRINPGIFVPGVFAAVALYLMYINHVTAGSWFLSFGLPVTVYLGALVTAVVLLLKYLRGRLLTILGGALIALGLFMPLMEYLIFVTFQRPRFAAWSVYPLISLVLLGGMLVFLAVNRRAREKMERKFFL